MEFAKYRDTLRVACILVLGGHSSWTIPWR
jgi:hypothetical protein